MNLDEGFMGTALVMLMVTMVWIRALPKPLYLSSGSCYLSSPFEVGNFPTGPVKKISMK
jgi:hypothetical protein